MSFGTFKRVAVAGALGIAFGLLMLLLALDKTSLVFGEQLLGSKNAMSVWKGVHLPALSFAKWWTYKAGLPPQNEAAWLLVPSSAVLGQWTLIAIMAGLWWALKRDRKAGGGGEDAGHAAAIPTEPGKQ